MLESRKASNKLRNRMLEETSLARSVTMVDISKSRLLNPEPKVPVVTAVTVHEVWIVTVCYSGVH